MIRTQDEHLEWAKARALQYIERGEIREGITSMGSDLSKHPELKNHPGIDIGFGLLLAGALSTRDEAKRFIEGFR